MTYRVNFIDLTDRQFDKWTVISYTANGTWLCECVCGAVKNVSGQSLRNGKSTSCGCGRLKNLPVILNSCSNVGMDGCWEWGNGKKSRGYGQVMHNYKQYATHRISWEQNIGPIPDGLHVLHRCDNPPCCRPDHLFLGTNLENIADKMAKGRHIALRGEEHKGSKLTETQVMEIRLADENAESMQSIAERYCISARQVGDIITGKCWSHLPVFPSAAECRRHRKCPVCDSVVSTARQKFAKHIAACKQGLDLVLGKE